MIRLFLSVCIVVAIWRPSAAEPMQAEWLASRTQLAELKIDCGRGYCTSRNFPSNCRWTRLGGVGRGNESKIVCDKKAPSRS
jgi:hypothetical protein